ncbi:adenylate/guanylate cyclase domain-containing protein [Microvirga aerilata]|uniref:Adenylate/guanylate cyclase domain-containing protein n=2 Tax=Microvirga aerilata TaxID=670292 RepID=A0A936ZKT0_9HYPH|nr:adenylate/guanylate cyclase domain-containing protein [Microvirga aerilata]MBL0407855.1 adenylate/guanylate cyclase domain-containing protein [Microvirga aerilata]
MGPQEHRVERRLAAIFAADVAGYARLMSQDEVGTLRSLTAYREIMDRLIAEHGGRIANTAGDSVLAEFPSAVDAVQCAAAVQEALAQANQDTPEERRIQFRIGVHVGDVMVRGGDLLGDGVNIAARLENLAEPGRVYISDATHMYVRRSPTLGFDDLGPQKIKNFDEPVRVYRVAASPSPSTGLAQAASPAKVLPLPDKPSIAVLPFTNMSGDPEQEYFADGMTEDIITGLSRLKWLFVIARNSTFAYKARMVDVRQVGQDLGVRYVLEGSVRVLGSRMRITSQLVEAASGRHIWAELYDRQLDDVFAVQDEITASVVAAIEPHLYAEEGARIASQPPDHISTWGLVVRAIGLISKLGRQESDEARSLLKRAISIEPTYAKAHAILGWAVWWAAYNYWAPDEQEGRAEAQKHAEQALALDASEPWARMILGLCLSADGQHERALSELEAALRVNPSFALAHTIHDGRWLALEGLMMPWGRLRWLFA